MNIFARPAMLLACCFALLACQRHEQVDLSQLGPPSHRLIGHWADGTGDQSYFGPLDATSGKGDFFIVHPDGQTFHHHYTLLNEEIDTQTAVINLLFADGDSRSESNVISADGNTLTSGTLIDDRYATEAFHRVDSATLPPKSYYMSGVSGVSDVSGTPTKTPHNDPQAARWEPTASLSQNARLSRNGIFARQRATNEIASYIIWLHMSALAILLVVSLMFYGNLGWLPILLHWTVAAAAGAICIFLFHALITAGILENMVALALLAKGLFPRSSLS